MTRHARRKRIFAQAAFTPPSANRTASSIAVLMGAGVLLCSQSAQSASAPLLIGGTLPVPHANFVSSGQASIARIGNTMNVNQTSQKAILNWNTFNIAQDSAVRFNQPGATAVALNRIFDANPASFGFDGSIIQGQLSANGQIYLINRNGILFGAGAQVNVNTLIATSLDIPDQRFRDGLLSRADFGPVFEDTTGLAGAVIVDVGARIDTPKGGRVMLFAPHVENRGFIATPDGQTVLAAGNKVYLRNSSDPNLRGFLVEVDTGLTAPDAAKAAVNIGEIVAERGNITMVGLAVRQGGRLTASTSVSANGSISLLARDTIELGDARDVNSVTSRRGGNLDLTASSLTQVLVDAFDTGTIDSNVTFNPSVITLQGKRVVHEGAIKAPSGNVSISAVADPTLVSLFGDRTDARVFLASGSSIDVSGTVDTVLPATRNQLLVELRGDELKDVPEQREGILRGQKVLVEVDRGTPVADVSKYIAAIPKGVGELSAGGGNVSIFSDGDAVIQPSARIDVSGGRIAFEAGSLDTTMLISRGRAYGIAVAPRDLLYDSILTGGIYTVKDFKWGKEQNFEVGTMFRRNSPAYTVGAPAGSVTLQAYALALDGSFIGRATPGERQREAGKIPVGGLLTLSDFLNIGNAGPTERTHDVVMAQGSTRTAPGNVDDPLPSSEPLTLSNDFISSGGFSRFKLDRNGSVEVPAGVDLTVQAGGSIVMSARSIDIAANITAPAGTISLTTRNVPDQPVGSLVIGGSSTLSTRGQWVNDLPATGGVATGTALINGGSIELNAANDLRLGAVDGANVDPTVIDVSGGGWVAANGSVRAGNGGNVTLSAGSFVPGALEPQFGSDTVQLGVTLKGFSAGAGGKLTLRGRDVEIRESAPFITAEGPTLQPGEIARSGKALTLPSWLFGSRGFGNFEVRATGDLTVASGTNLNVTAPYLAFASNPRAQPSGADIYAFTRVEALPEVRAAANLTLNHTGHQAESRLTLARDARISADPGASVNLSTLASMVVDGEISAPAGTISVALKAVQAQPYAAEQSIWLGANAKLSAQGAAKLQTSPTGIRSGKVLDGGTISVSADHGYVVAERGSVIDVSGIEATLDVRQLSGAYIASPIAGRGGNINVTASEGILLDATLAAHGGNNDAAGGALALRTTTANRLDSGIAFPAGNRAVVLRAGDADAVPAGLRRGDPVKRAQAEDLNGLALFNVNKLATGGFSQFTARSDHEVRFAGDVRMTLPRSLALDAPLINVDRNSVTLAAPVITLGPTNPVFQTAPAAAPSTNTGVGALDVRADLIELVGNTTLEHTAKTTLSARGDLRARGVQDLITNRLTGRFAATGELELNAAQVYPTTQTEFAISSANTLSVTPNGASIVPPLSAGGSLTLSAPDITVSGTLRAPFGTLDLKATETLTLAPGSVTSVSGVGLVVPYGTTQNGADWVYSPVAGINTVVGAPPEKNIRLTAKRIALAPSATVDLSGGGELYAYEFVPGPGGSKDAVANVIDGKASTIFAIVPGLSSTYAPYDQQSRVDSLLAPGAYPDSGLRTDESIYLAGGGGLAAGNYVLLPARYALLPGAFLVKPVAGFDALVPGRPTALTNGTPVVAGYRTWVNGARDERWSAYTVQPGSAARTLAEYRDNYATAFFAKRAAEAGILAPQLPIDAGRLAINVSESLALAGANLNTTRPAAGYYTNPKGETDTSLFLTPRGAQVDITARRLAITDAGGATSPALDTFVKVRADDLNRLNAESILLGGIRHQISDGVEVRVGADEVVLANSAADAVQAPEVMVAANERITVKGGSVIVGSGATGARSSNVTIGYLHDPAAPVTDPAQIRQRDINGDGAVTAADNIDGRGAFLRAASGAQISLSRSNVADRTRGILEIENGASVGADNALILDATADTVVGATARIGAGRLVRDTNDDGRIDAADRRVGGSISLAAGLVSMGATQAANGGAGVQRGLVLQDTLLDQLREVDTLAVRSYSTIDLYGSATLGTGGAAGNPLLANLELSAGGIAGYGGATDRSTFAARTLRLSNTEGATFAGAASGTGALELAAERLILGAGAKTVRGFADVTLTASSEISNERRGGLDVAAALTLRAPRITAAPAAAQNVRAVNFSDPPNPAWHSVVIAPAVSATPLAASNSVGANLSIEGARVTHGGVIDIAGGRVELKAQSPGGDITLEAGSRVAAPGYTRTLADRSVAISGGDVRLTSTQGNVVVAEGAVIDVSGVGSDAGRLEVSAPMGVASIKGTLLGAAPTGFNSGRFKLDARLVNHNIAQNTNDFAALNTLLNAGGFLSERSLRLRTGNVAIGAQDEVIARAFSLTADGGRVDVFGRIDASAPGGGEILLTARDGVTVAPQASLLAHATAEGGSGGRVMLFSSDGAVDVAAGSSVHVSKYVYAASDVNTNSASGAANAYSASMTDSPAAYSKDLTVVFTAASDSNGASTFSLNGLPSVSIKRSDGTDITDDIRTGDIVKLTFDGKHFRLPAGEGGSVHLRAARNAAGNDVPITVLGEVRGAREIVAEAYKTYVASNITGAGANSATNFNAATTGAGYTGATAFVTAVNANASGVRTRLSASAAERFHLRPGIEITTSADLNVSVDTVGWNLSPWRFGGEPGVLTLRAGGNVNFTRSLGDGFIAAAGAMSTWANLLSGESWSYRITAGADLTSANPHSVHALSGINAVAQGSGNVIVNANTLVRTGTGSIDIHAARDFVLGENGAAPLSPTAAVYTAGTVGPVFPTSGPESFPAFAGALFPYNGGDLFISAGQDVRGAVTRQLVSEWLVRRGQTNATTGGIVATRNPAWGINFTKFAQNVGALGGGDVVVRAERDIDNLSAVVPTTGRLLGAAGTLPDAGNLVVTGGGDLTIQAGRDIRSGLFYVGRGNGVIHAAESIVAGRTVNNTNPTSGLRDTPVNTVLALGDGRMDVRAGIDATIETVLSPTAVAQDSTVGGSNRTYFFTYSPNAAVSMAALAGDLLLSNNETALRASAPNINFASNSLNANDETAMTVYPGTLKASAPNGSISVARSFTLFPSPRGNLELLAERDVKLDLNADPGRRIINLSDADPQLLLNPLHIPNTGALVGYEDTFNRLTPFTFPRLKFALTPVHTGDTEPVRIIANQGSITGGQIYLAKRAELTAGVDIRDIVLDTQHVSSDDVSIVSAARNISFETPRNPLTGVQIENAGRIVVNGPGRLEVSAGGNVDLGNSQGIVSRGNLGNPALAPEGADIAVAVGSAGTRYSAFITQYFDDSSKRQVAQYVRNQLNNGALTDQAAIALFDDLGASRQLKAPFMPVLRSVFFDELKKSGAEATSKALRDAQPDLFAALAAEEAQRAAESKRPVDELVKQYGRGFAAIETLFPGAEQAAAARAPGSAPASVVRGVPGPAYRGVLSLLFSQIKTESGGNIDLLVPGGLINAGQTTPPAQSGSTKGSDQLGILVFDTGGIRSFSKGSFVVNESRVFTLKGGGILLWSAEGDIDAGRGAKTAVSAPPPTQVTDSNGNTTLKFLGVSGSGIRSILTDASITAGDVDLVAPRGEVNAGDAGIGSAGNLNIAAERVVGADNIQVGGQSSGVPIGDTGSTGLALAGVSTAAAGTTKAAEQAAPTSPNTATPSIKPSFINVEVIGLGVDACTNADGSRKC